MNQWEQRLPPFHQLKKNVDYWKEGTFRSWLERFERDLKLLGVIPTRMEVAKQLLQSCMTKDIGIYILKDSERDLDPDAEYTK